MSVAHVDFQTRELGHDPVMLLDTYLPAEVQVKAYEKLCAGRGLWAAVSRPAAGLWSAAGPSAQRLRTVSLPRAAELLGMTRATAYRLRRKDAFPVPVVTVDGRFRVLVEDIEELTGAHNV